MSIFTLSKNTHVRRNNLHNTYTNMTPNTTIKRARGRQVTQALIAKINHQQTFFTEAIFASCPF
ncbi:MAG TPA: hypothetical protein VGF79_15915 [Bacteroidia bacterium]